MLGVRTETLQALARCTQKGAFIHTEEERLSIIDAFVEVIYVLEGGQAAEVNGDRSSVASRFGEALCAPTFVTPSWANQFLSTVSHSLRSRFPHPLTKLCNYEPEFG